MDEIRGNESVVRMRTIVQGWLASEDWTTTQLIDWFQGYNLPAVGHDEEPYLWLLRGVPEADERHAAEKKFAGRAAMLLKEKPDVKRPGKRPDQALYNLFMLCAGLSCPDELADPLFRVFERRQLKGKWRGIDIRSALKSALISNQKDSRVFASWEKLLLNGKNEFFTVDEFEFLDAARLMPESEDKRGEPALNAIGKAFKMMASKLEPDHERRIRYRSIVNKVIETYPGRPTWNLDLLRQADGNVWPIWSIECLPSLYVPILDNGSSDRTLTWHYLVSCIPWPLNYRVVGSMCQEQVFELEMADTTAEFVESIAPVFERNRLCNPYPSERSTVGIIIASMIETGIDPNSAPIGEILKDLVGGLHRKEELRTIIEPVLAIAPEGARTKDNLVQMARKSHWEPWCVSYIQEMRVAA